MLLAEISIALHINDTLEEAEIDDLLKVIDPRIAKVKELALSVFEHRQIRWSSRSTETFNQRSTTMGMDVYGKNPTAPEGNYFRNSVWCWRPLAVYILQAAPRELISKCRYWHSNDGAGLNQTDSLKLAAFLQAEIESGRTKQYEIRYKSELELMPDEPCELCESTGTRKPPPQCGAGDPKADGVICNGCAGKGFKEPFAKYYPFYTENVQEFVTFLRGCGGFKIC